MRLFVLPEVECHKLDQTMAIQTNNTQFGPSYKRYADALHRELQLKDEQHSMKNALQVLEQLFTYSLSTGGAASASSPAFQQLVVEIVKTKQRLAQLVSQLLSNRPPSLNNT